MRVQKKNDRKKPAETTALRIIQRDVAGIDVGSSEHWVCGPGRDDGQPNVEVFATTTEDLNRLAD